MVTSINKNIHFPPFLNSINKKPAVQEGYKQAQDPQKQEKKTRMP